VRTVHIHRESILEALEKEGISNVLALKYFQASWRNVP
jgi:hypothetical protein